MGSTAQDSFKCTGCSCSMLFWVMFISQKQSIPSLPRRGSAEGPWPQCGLRGKPRAGAPLPVCSWVSHRQAPSPVTQVPTQQPSGCICAAAWMQKFFSFFFPFCSDHVVPVTRAIWHTCRKNTPGSCQLLGRENVLGCLKYASHVDFLIICLVFKAKYSGTVKTCQHLVDFAAELINRFWWRGMRIKGMCLERHSLFGNLIFLYLSLLFLIFWYSIININSTGHVCFNSCGF